MVPSPKGPYLSTPYRPRPPMTTLEHVVLSLSLYPLIHTPFLLFTYLSWTPCPHPFVHMSTASMDTGSCLRTGFAHTHFITTHITLCHSLVLSVSVTFFLTLCPLVHMFPGPLRLPCSRTSFRITVPFGTPPMITHLTTSPPRTPILCPPLPRRQQTLLIGLYCSSFLSMPP